MLPYTFGLCHMISKIQNPILYCLQLYCYYLHAAPHFHRYLPPVLVLHCNSNFDLMGMILWTLYIPSFHLYRRKSLLEKIVVAVVDSAETVGCLKIQKS